MNIDKKKLKAAILELNANRWTHTAEEATLLYSLMAHSRGRLHIKKQWVPTYAADGGRRLETRDMQWQEGFVSHIAAQFVLEEDVAA